MSARSHVSAAAAVALLGASGEAQAAPLYLRLSYTGDTTTTMAVTWNTMVPADTVVRYGLSAGTLTETVTGRAMEANTGLGYVHEVVLTGLEPSTKYYYVAGSDTDGYFAEASFTTGPVQTEACGWFKFAFLGDNRPDPVFGGGENWPAIVGQAILQQPAFVLNGGDLVIAGTESDQWHNFLGWTATISGTTPFLPAIGNHDTGPGEGEGANYNQLFALPRSSGAHGSGTEDYYFFTYGNAIIVALSTEGFKSGAIPFEEQAAWLDEVLTNNPRRWKFVFYHKPTYTHEAFFSISHAPNEDAQNAAWVPIIDKHHVDVVFTSHNHWYERFEPSACATQGRPGGGEACPVGADNFAGGTVYYVSGGAGAFTIPGFLCGKEEGRAKCSGDHHYIVVDIQNEVAKIETWGAAPQDNQVIDSVTIVKPTAGCTVASDAGPPDSPAPDSAPADGFVQPVDVDTPDASSPPGGPAGAAGSAPTLVSAERSADSGGCGFRLSPVARGSAGGLALLAITAAAFGLRRRRAP